MTAKTYRIRSITDLLAVPVERREACMHELLLALCMIDLSMGEAAQTAFPDGIEWTDDGDASVTVQVGDEKLTLEVTKEGAA